MGDQGLFWQGPIWALFGMTWVFGVAVVLIVVWHLRSRRRIERLKIVHEERMRAMEKGVPLPEFPEIGEDQSAIIGTLMKINPKWPLGLGALIIMTSLGILVAPTLSTDPEYMEVWSAGFVGVFTGVGLVLYYFLTRAPKA